MLEKFIDAHVHLNTPSREKMEMAIKHNVSFLSINTHIPFFEPLIKQEEVVMELQKNYPRRIQFITSFDFKDWGNENFAQSAIEQIKRGMQNGAVGVKIWKDVGFDLHDAKGNFVMIDDPVFDPIFEYLVKNNILLIGHQGEPRNCWLPLEEMTVDSDRDYFREHPEYHMFLQKHYTSRDNMLGKFPDLKYVGLHLFSLEWSIEEVAARLEKYPNSKTDLAERICHLQLQAIENWKEVRDFCIKYRDRIIYGTDIIDDGNTPAESIAQRFENIWEFHYKFFATGEILNAPEFKGDFNGLDLPEEVVKKLFYTNAKNTYRFYEI